MKLDWRKTTNGTPLRRPAHYAVSDGIRYEVTGAAGSFTARVYRINKTRAPRMLLAYDDDRAQKCIEWCQRFEDQRIASQAKADQVRKHTAPQPRLKRAGYYRPDSRRHANIG